MYREIPLVVRGHTIEFYDFMGEAGQDTEQKIAALWGYFNRMPDSHLAVVCPILLVQRTANHGETRDASRIGSLLSRHRIQRSGVSADDLAAIVNTQHESDGVCRNTGIIEVPVVSWNTNRYHFTVFHEVGHSVHYELNLNPTREPVSRASELFQGVRPACGGTGFGRYTAEAYARLLICPNRICREAPHGSESRHAQNQRIIDLLWRSPAFQGVAPGSLARPSEMINPQTVMSGPNPYC